MKYLNTKTSRALWCILLAGGLLTMTGCGDEEESGDAHGDEHSDEEHSCEHFENGPTVTVSAVADTTGEVPESFEEHHRIDVTVPDGSDVAIVQWTPEEAGEFEFWLSKDVTFALMDEAGPLTAEESGGAAMGCETLAVAHHKYDVEAKSYMIQFGPGLTAGDTIGFVAEHLGEHSEGDGHNHGGE